ncbi:MAG: redoxin domain-containing protein [Mycoplasmataceae bacterium]|nr:redoxin domain-containing protein [Mycoplasmataceae bacterium]
MHDKHINNECSFAKIGKTVSNFELEAVLEDKTFGTISLENNKNNKKWTVLFFWPADFTFVCPTEIEEFNRLAPQFKENNAELIGISTDKKYSHLAWINERKWEMNIPLASDPTGKLANYFQIYDCKKGIAQRGTFIIDPSGKLWHIGINFGEAGRNPKETLRTLQACINAEAGKIIPCAWKPGEKFLPN